MKNSANNEIAVIENKETFIQKFEPREMIRSFGHVRTMENAIKEDSNGLAYYRKHLGEKTIEILLKMHIANLNASVNVHSKLDEMQIDEIALEIISMYHHLSPIEVGFIFRQAKRGVYGKIDYALNMPSILSWFDNYAERRSELFRTRQIDYHSNFKGIHDERSEDRLNRKRHDQMKNNQEFKTKNND